MVRLSQILDETLLSIPLVNATPRRVYVPSLFNYLQKHEIFEEKATKFITIDNKKRKISVLVFVVFFKDV